MSGRRQRVLTEAGRFLAVGGVATLVALFLFNLLVHGLVPGREAWLRDEPVLAYVLANTVGMLISFHGSRTWAFRDRSPVHADGGLTAFVAINIATMTLPVACLAISRDVLGLDDPVSDNLAANVIGLALGLGARFYLFRAFVFRRPINLNDLYTPEGAEPARERADAVLSDPSPRGPSRHAPAPPPAP